MEIDYSDLGTLDLDGMWVPFIDLVDAGFLPTRLTVSGAQYDWESSILVKGHGAVLPGKVRALRASGKKPLIVERDDRYFVFVS